MKFNYIPQESSRTFKVDLINLDASSSPRVRSEVLPLLDDPRPLMLDLSSVQFADSSGLGVLCDFANRARVDQLKFIGVSDRLTRILARVPALDKLQDIRPRLTILTA